MEQETLDLQQIQNMASVSVSPSVNKQNTEIPKEETTPVVEKQPAPIEEAPQEPEKTIAELHEELKPDEVVVEETKEETKEEVKEEIEEVKAEHEDMSWYQWVKDNDWFNSFIDKIYEAVEDSKNEAKFAIKQKEVLEKKYNEIVDKYNEIRSETKTKDYEASRFALDDDDEYILSIKQKLKKNPADENLRAKLRDLYLQQVWWVDEYFDPFEQKQQLAQKRSVWIQAMSQWTKSSATSIVTKQEEWFVAPFVKIK